MILCAGMGTRLRPLSDRWPKAAIPLLGRPLFRFGVELFQRAGLTALAINTHHLAEIMKTVASAECARAGLPLQIAYEPTIQGTAGGIRGMRQLLKDDHFAVLNGDVLFSVDLARVAQAHLQSGASATMVLMPMPVGDRYAAVEADSAARVRRIAGRGPGGAALRQWHFTGLHLMSPAVFDFMSAEGPEDINRDVYPRMLDKGLTIRAEIAQEYWSDLGTPARYLHTHLDLLAGRAPDILSGPAFSGMVQREGELWLRRAARARALRRSAEAHRRPGGYRNPQRGGLGGHRRVGRAPNSSSAEEIASGRVVPRENAGHVVASACRIRQVDQLRAGGLQLRGLQQRFLDVIVGNHPRQAVRAQQEKVAILGIEPDDVDLNGVLHSQRPDNRVLVRESFDLVGGQLFCLEVVVEQRVIFGKLLQDSISK